MRGRPVGTTGTLHRHGTAALIVDILSTEQRWVSLPVLTDWVTERRNVQPRSVERALRRLVTSGMVKQRVTPQGHFQEYFSDEWSAGAA